MALRYTRSANTPAAVQSLCQAVDLNPADAKALSVLGKMYDISPETADEVTKRLARFVELYPDSSQTNDEGRPSEAAEQYEAAVRLRNNLTAAHYRLAPVCEARETRSFAQGI